MTYPWRVTVEPAGEPVTLAELKMHLRVQSTSEDALLNVYLSAARKSVERYLNRAIVEQTQEIAIDYQWPDRPICLPNAPLISVEGVTYLDGDGVEQTLDPSLYVVDTVGEPGRIERAYNATWPGVRWQIATIKVAYKAGFVPGGDPATDYGAHVPADWKHAIKLLAGHFYENREIVSLDGMPRELQFTLRALLDLDRIHPIG